MKNFVFSEKEYKIKKMQNEFLDIIGSASPKFADGLKRRRIAESQMFLS